MRKRSALITLAALSVVAVPAVSQAGPATTQACGPIANQPYRSGGDVKGSAGATCRAEMRIELIHNKRFWTDKVVAHQSGTWSGTRTLQARATVGDVYLTKSDLTNGGYAFFPTLKF